VLASDGSPGEADRPPAPDAAVAESLQPSGPSRVWTGDSDEALAARATNGDTRAFEVLVGRYERVVFSLTLRMTGNRQDARDLTQEVFLRAWRGLRGFDSRMRFFSWIYRIAIHASLNLRRGAVRRELLDWEPESNEGGPEDAAEAHELERDVEAALARLSNGDRQLIVLRHFLDQSYEEIAEILSVPAARVKSRLFEARQRLRRELERRGRKP
jgi:RNA polymerase sigma-70 factor (ECF subfamily)